MKIVKHQTLAKVGYLLLCGTVLFLAAGIISGDMRITWCATACGVAGNGVFFVAIAMQDREFWRKWKETYETPPQRRRPERMG